MPTEAQTQQQLADQRRLRGRGVKRQAIQDNVELYMEANKDRLRGDQGIAGPRGPTGSDGQDGAVGTRGRDGTNGVDGQRGLSGFTGDRGPQGLKGDTGAKGETGLQGPTGNQGPAGVVGPVGPVGPSGATGPKGDRGLEGATGPQGVAGPKGDAGAQGAKGDTGTTGPAFGALLANVAVGQSGLVLAGGIREVTVACVGTIVGERYNVYCRSYKLNGGAVVLGKPAGYSIIDASCNVAGQIIVSLNAPALTLLTSYVINCDIVKVTTA